MYPGAGSDIAEKSKKTRSTDQKRRYGPELKLQVVRETLAPEASVSIVSRRHDINANLVFTWRKQFREGGLAGVKDSGFIPVKRVDDQTTLRALPAPAKANGGTRRPAAGLIEIVMPGGVVVRVDARVDGRRAADCSCSAVQREPLTPMREA
jgi:transposase